MHPMAHTDTHTHTRTSRLYLVWQYLQCISINYLKSRAFYDTWLIQTCNKWQMARIPFMIFFWVCGYLPIYTKQYKGEICSFPQISAYFWKFLILWKSRSENKGKLNLVSAESITLWKLFDCAEVFPQNVTYKGDILFDFHKTALLLWLVAT